MFATQTLAARIDRAEGRLCAGIADAARAAMPGDGTEVFDIGGGVAVYAGSGSPTNKMIAVGFDGVPSDHELARVERAFAKRRSPLQAEISTLADPAVHALLVRRGYEPRGFENVLGHSLSAIGGASPGAFEIRRPADDEYGEWARAIVTAFSTPDVGGVGADAIPASRLSDDTPDWFTITMRVPGFEGLVAFHDGRIVAGSSLRLDDGIAQFCGAATLPAFRRRGLQTALIRLRLERARAAGCDVAVVCTQPGSKSQENVEREGFSVLYARQIFVKKP